MSPQRILVVYVSRIGDTMLISPAIRALSAFWPFATISFLGSATSAEVFRHLPFVSHVDSTTKKWVRFKGWVCKDSYDLALVYGYDGDTPFVRYALRVAKQVIAFRQKDEGINRRLFAAVDKPPFQSCHSVDHFLSLIEPLGVPNAGRQLSYVVSDEEKRFALKTIKQLREPSLIAPLVGLQISSFPTKAYRDWPVENFLRLARLILQHWPSSHFLIFGGALERKRTRWLASQLGHHATHFAGEIKLRESAALMEKLDLYIGVDTGPTHIMGTLKKPMIVLYHGYSPSWFLAPLDHPCLWAIDHPRAGQVDQSADMAEISVDRVWDAVQQALHSVPML